MPRTLVNTQRYDHHFFHGWHVGIKRQGRRYERYFSDGPDRAVALRRALRWRDQMLAILPPPRRFKRRHVRNTTGVIGVSYSRERTRRGTTMRRYCATWVDEKGRQRKRSFSVAKYGAEKARSLAVKARIDALKTLLRPVRPSTWRPERWWQRRRSTRHRSSRTSRSSSASRG